MRRWEQLASALVLGTLGLGMSDRVSAECVPPPSEHALISPTGLAVEGITPGSVAEHAGLRPGDVLLRWKRGDAEGVLNSPFSLLLVELEHGPRGPVHVLGCRQTQEQTWLLDSGPWGMQTRPLLYASALWRYSRGTKFASGGIPARAAQEWRRLAADLGQSDVRWITPWLLFHAADTLAQARQWKEAEQEYGEAIAQAGTSTELKATILKAKADKFLRLQKWDSARTSFEQMLEESRKISPDNLLSASALHGLGIIAYMSGDYRSADKFYRQSLATRNKLVPDSLAVVASLNNLASIAIQEGNLTVARGYLEQGIAIAERLAPNTLELAKSLHNLGKISFLRGDLEQAEKLDSRELRIKEKVAPDSMEVSISFNSLGTVAEERGDWTRAEDYYRRALILQKRFATRSVEVAATLNNLGTLAWERSDLDAADGFFHGAQKILEQIAPNSLDLAAIWTNLASTAYQRGDLTRAESLHRKALAIEERVGPGSLEVAESLSNLGGIAQRRGDLDSAREYQSQALTLQLRRAPGSLAVARTLGAMGMVALSNGDLSLAEDYYRRSLAIWERLAPSTVSHAESLAGLGQVMNRRGDLTAASQIYEQAIDALESQTARLGGSERVRYGFRAKHSDYYRILIDLLLRRGETQPALETLERSRARSLLETLAEARIEIRKGADPSLLAEEQALLHSIQAKSARRIGLLTGQHSEDELLGVEHEVEELSRQYEDVEGRIRTASPAYASLMQPRPLSAKEIQGELLDPDTLLLEYSLGDERSYVFAVGAALLTAHELPRRSEIERKARVVYKLLTARNQVVRGETEQRRQVRLALAGAEYEKSAAELSNMVLGPVAGELKGKRILIVSDGALQYIPFSALPVAEDRQEAVGARSSSRRMVEHEIVNLPSASVLAVLRQSARITKNRAGEVAFLGDPVFTATDVRVGRPAHGQLVAAASTQLQSSAVSSRLTRSLVDTTGGVHLARLPFSRVEARAISAAVQPKDGLVALDFQASRATARSSKLGNYRIVHFATHGLVNSEHPELSGLVFSLVDAAGRPQNGFLDLQDIYNMNLSADLVVLSACETALGKSVSGEGLIGLTRGFMHAGAKSVVASLWTVSDIVTAKLMEQFYRAMEIEGLQPAAALRAAQIRLRQQKRWSSPYYWAGFQLQGDWK